MVFGIIAFFVAANVLFLFFARFMSQCDADMRRMLEQKGKENGKSF